MKDHQTAQEMNPTEELLQDGQHVPQLERDMTESQGCCSNRKESCLCQALQEELSTLQDKNLRVWAEFENYKKRHAEERRQVERRAEEQLLLTLLPVLDDLERAVAAYTGEAAGEEERKGVAMIADRLAHLLRQRGAEPIEAVAHQTAFDPFFHEAVGQKQVENPEHKGKVVAVLRQGYTLSGKPLRPAQVIVGA